MSMLKDFVAYQLARELYFHARRRKLPPFLYDQLQRASASVVLNLAEGSGKTTTAEQRRFYAIAFGSFRECQAIFELESREIEGELGALLDRLGAMLFKLSQSGSANLNLRKKT